MAKRSHHKNKGKKSAQKNSTTLDTRRGSSMWALNRLRSDGLVQLMEDLHALEEVGLPPEHCHLVQSVLDNLVIRASAIPDRGLLFGKSIMNSLEKFAKYYQEWNEIQEKDQKAVHKRQVALKRMRLERHRLARIIRTHTAVLAEELDLMLVKDLYETLGEIPKALPETFVHLSKAMARFLSVLNKIYPEA